MRQVKTAFYLIKSKINRKGDAPVYIRIKFGGQTINLSTGMYLKPDDWDQKKLKVKLKHKQGLAFNNQLKNLEEKALAVCTNLIENGDRISLKKVKLM